MTQCTGCEQLRADLAAMTERATKAEAERDDAVDERIQSRSFFEEREGKTRAEVRTALARLSRATEALREITSRHDEHEECRARGCHDPDADFAAEVCGIARAAMREIEAGR